jgi:hypothetical protein
MREKQRLEKDNLSMIARLRNQNSRYSQARFQEERKEQENLLHRISEYPYMLGNNGKLSRVQSAKKGLNNDKIVFMKRIDIGGKSFDVEIYRNLRKIIIFAFDGEEIFKLAVSIDDANALMKNENDYESVVERLDYENETLILME